MNAARISTRQASSQPLTVSNVIRPGENRALGDIGAYVKTLNVSYETDDYSLLLGQFEPNFGRRAAQAFRLSRAAAFDERTALLEKLWRAGELGTSDYLVQLKQSLDTALSGLELQSQAWQAWFDYLSAAGRLTDWIDGRNQDASP